MGKKSAKCFKKNPFTLHENFSRPALHGHKGDPTRKTLGKLVADELQGALREAYGRERPGTLRLGGTFAQNAGSLPPIQGFSAATNSHSETRQFG